MLSPETQKPTTDQIVLLVDEQNIAKPPKPNTINATDQDIPALNQSMRTKTHRRLNFSKPKSRFAETNYPTHDQHDYKPITDQTNLHTSSDEDDEDDDDDLSEEEENGEAPKKHRKKNRKILCGTVVEWVSFVLIMAALICSLTVKRLKHNTMWHLPIWQWCLMVLVIISGRLVSGWVVGLLVFLVERNFMLREKVLYFVYGLRKSFKSCVWLALVLLVWSITFIPSETQRHHRILKKVFRALIGVLIGAIIWLVNTLLIKIHASSFHVTTFFDRMKESVFHHYILEMLSGPPLDESEMESSRRRILTKAKTLPARLRDSNSNFYSKYGTKNN